MTSAAPASNPDPLTPLSVLVLGAGKVGQALTAALRHGGAEVSLLPSRGGWPVKIRAAVVLLTCRDRDIPGQAAAFARVKLTKPNVVLMHCAGALSYEILAPAARAGVALGQWHPLLSFSDGEHPPTLTDGYVRVAGDDAAVVAGRWLCARLGMHPVLGVVEPVLYHAAAVLLANGTAALMDAACRTLILAGVDRHTAQKMLLPLLGSVLENVAQQGVPQALSGPVRRGAHATVARHMQVLYKRLPAVASLYQALARIQLDMAAQLGDAPAAELASLRDVLSSPPAAPAPGPAHESGSSPTGRSVNRSSCGTAPERDTSGGAP